MRPIVIDLRIGWDDESNSTFVEGNLSLGSIHPSGIHYDIVRDLREEMDFEAPVPFRCYLTVPLALTGPSPCAPSPA
jgi:hypothetical protein